MATSTAFSLSEDLRQLFEISPHAMVVMDGKGQCWTNEAWEQASGCMLSYILPDLQVADQELRKKREESPDSPVQLQFDSTNSTQLCRCQFQGLRLPNHPDLTIWTLHGSPSPNLDTPRELERLARVSREMIWELNSEGVYTYISAVSAEWLGIPPEEIIGNTKFKDLFHPSEEEANRKELAASISPSSVLQGLRILLRDKNGNPLPVSRRCSVRRNSRGDIVGYFGSDQDLRPRELSLEQQEFLTRSELTRNSMRKQANLLKESDFLKGALRLAADLFDTEHAFLFLLPPKGQHLELVNLTDSSTSQAVPGPLAGRHPLPQDGLLSECISKHSPRLQNRDDETAELDPLLPKSPYMLVPVVDHGELIMLLGVSGREKAFRQSELSTLGHLAEDMNLLVNRIRTEVQQTLLNRAVDQAGEMVVITDSQGVITYANSAFVERCLKEKEELLGQAVSDLLEKKCCEDMADFWKRLEQGSSWCGHHESTSPDGSPRYEDITILPVTLPRSGDVHQVALIWDVTKETELQEEVLQARRLESVGHLAGGIANEFNNIITVIMGNFGYLQQELETSKGLEPQFEQITEALQRAALLTRQLLSFARKQTLRQERMDLNQLIRDLYPMMLRLLPDSLQLRLHLHPEPLWIQGDRVLLEQMLITLLIRSRDAVHSVGRVEVGTRLREEILPQEHFIHASKPNGERSVAQIFVEDDGTALTQGNPDKIFEPFADQNQGSGSGVMGLPSALGIVTNHQGHLSVLQKEQGGSRITAWLPLEEANEEEDGGEQEWISSNGTGRILVVEDQDLVRSTCVQSLNAMGFQTLEAASGADALQAIASSNELEVIFTDVLLPDGPSFDITRQAQKRFPELRIFYTSGYSLSDLKPEISRKLTGRNFLSKPYDRQDLERMLGLRKPKRQPAS